MRVISVLQMMAFGMAEWRRLPKLGSHTGPAGRAMSNLWEWTLSYRTPRLSRQSGQSRITGFAARVRIGGFVGRRRVVKADTVSTAISAIGKEIALACGVNPTKLKYSEKSLPRIAQMLDGWRKKDEPVMKKFLPVEVDVPQSTWSSWDWHQVLPNWSRQRVICL
jgi:hypothetical protein